MKRIAIILFALILSSDAFGQDAPKLMRGAKRTPINKIIAAVSSGAVGVHRVGAVAAPSQVVTVPKRLSMWGNSQFGCCVTSESAFAIADYSTYVGIDEVFVTEATVISWARDHGWLNGADLLSVIVDMQSDGIKDEKGVLRKAGKSSSVDYTNESILQSAIAQGPVSIAIDADALPSDAGSKSGWFAFGGRSFQNTDHCVSLGGYGPTAELFKALGKAVPAGAPASGYFLFTWNTIGVVDHKWLMNTCVEAWVRNPTVTNLQPPPPPPPPPPPGPAGTGKAIIQIPGFPDKVFTFPVPSIPKDVQDKADKFDAIKKILMPPAEKASPMKSSRIIILCDPLASVQFAGEKPSEQVGDFREFLTPAISTSETQCYVVFVNGRRRIVPVKGGREIEVDFRSAS